ncbi:hypothetical protein M8J76_001322 [Diaphorina citri]|nr:hypothetical protein M8J76_001322 [Diaphorina citri]
MSYDSRNKISLFRHIFLSFSKTYGSEKSSTDTSSSSGGPQNPTVSTRNSVMRRLPPHNKETSGGSSSSSSGLASAGVTPPASPSTSKTSASSSGGTRVTLRLNQNQLKTRASHDEPGGLGGKKCKVNLASSSGAYSSAESVDGGSDASGSTSKVKMENMEEILLKENTSAIETNTSQVSNQHTSKVKMENMEEILLKENTSAIETNTSQVSNQHTSKVKMENMEEILLKENTSAIETNTSQVSNQHTSKVKMENMEEILLKENTSAIETNTSQVSNQHTSKVKMENMEEILLKENTSAIETNTSQVINQHTSKVKMENMEEILLKENTSAIETNTSQDETKDPLADTESVISPAGSSTSHHDKTGSDKEGADKEGGGVKRGADNTNSSDEESKKKKRKEESGGANSGIKSKASSVSEGGSPKSNPGGNESDVDDTSGGAPHLNKNIESPSSGVGGPKVPPLKIVLPSASAAQESDLSAGGSGRNGKSGTARHSALPYVVASDIEATSAPVSPSNSAPGDTAGPGGEGDKTVSVKQEMKQEPMTEEQRTTQRILRSSHSRGSSSSSPAAPDVSPSTIPVNTPPTSAVHSPAPPETTTIKSEPQSSLSNSNPGTTGNPTSSNPTTNTGADEKPPLSSAPPSDDPSPSEVQTTLSSSVDLHPRKRKLKHARADSSWNSNTVNSSSACANTSVTSSTTSATAGSSGTNASATGGSGTEVKEESVSSGPPTSTDQPFTNCYQLYLNIRKQIDLRRKGLFPVKPITPTKFARYLMVTCDYVLANNNSSRHNVPKYEPPACLPPVLKDLFTLQESERYKLRMQHVVEKEKFALGVEQEILRVHCHAARELANQPLPYSACTILKDEEVYNLIGPDTDDKDSLEHKKDKRTDRYRYNGRLFIKWLRDIDDKWDKIKKRMIIRQTNEAESLHAVQKMDWEWKVRESNLEVPPPGEESYVPMISIVDDLQSTDELAS